MIPNLFAKQDIPDKLPAVLDEKIWEIYEKTSSNTEYLEQSFYFITNTWKGNRFGFATKLHQVFLKDIDHIVSLDGYHHCTTMNYLLRIMAVRSNHFIDEDIKLKLTHSWYLAPHQYLEVTLDNSKTIYVDPWNYQFGIDFGSYGSGFDSTKIFPVR